MKIKTKTRLISGFLAVVMVFIMIPFAAIPVIAENITNVDEMGHLGKGFNMLGDQQLTNSSLAGYEIFKSAKNMSMQKTTGSFNSSEFTYINDMQTFLNEQSASASVGLDASAKFKLFSLEAKFKYGLSSSSSTESSQEYEYAILEHYASRLKKTLDLTKDSFIESSRK